MNNLIWYDKLPKNRLLEVENAVKQIRYGVWIFGSIACILASIERVIAVFANPHLVLVNLPQIFAPLILLSSWLYLKPDTIEADGYYANYYLWSSSEEAIKTELGCSSISHPRELKNLHIISQEYILPFPYLCQIYHLLSLKHLETVHKFSLNNLKIVNVTNIHSTHQGGKIKFATVLESPWNILRIWRKPVVEVDLILHNAYTVELSIPVHQNKRIIVVFNALPLTSNEHYFFVDIYSDLPWFRPFLQVFMHLAASLTLWEDLPYLRSLQESNIERLFLERKFPQHENMWLYGRFMEIYRKTENTFISAS